MRDWNFENDRYKSIKDTQVLSVWEWQQLMSTPKKYKFKDKNWKIPKIKTTLSMCLSQIIKIVLGMLISGILLGENRRWAPG